VYLGSLDVVFENVKSVKSADGIFAFSVELLDEGRPMDYLCMNVARFAHKKSYIENLANAVGFEVLAMRESVLRKVRLDENEIPLFLPYF
jgi:predicted TPR repeat methyltransferase